MPRLDLDRQFALEPKRVEFAVKFLESHGFTIHYKTDKEIRFMFKGEEVIFFPYSGWHTGKSIVDGRGFEKLKSQITS